MEGLSISEILLSKLEYSMRFDAEYYQPIYLQYENLIKIKKSCLLSDVASFLIGPFGSAFTVDNYTDDKTYRYIRGKDVKPLKLMNNDNVYMPKADYERLSKYALKNNDILVSVVGTLGNAAIVSSDDLPAIFSCKSTVLRTTGVNAKYLLAYLNSKYGKELLLRKERGAIQKGLNLDDLKTLDVFISSEKFQENIESIFNVSYQKSRKANKLYSEVEKFLLQKLNFIPVDKLSINTNIKSLKESFLSTGRLDAEYYQPKYEDYYHAISHYENGFTFIRDEFEHIIFSSKKKETGYYYIEIGDISISDGSCQANYIESEYLPANAKIIAKKGDILISNVRPNRGAVSIIDIDSKNLIVSGAFTVLRTKQNSQYSNELLKVLLRLPIYRDWLLQFNVGTQYPVIKDEDILNLPIPLFSDDIQNKVTIAIRQSGQLKKQSEQLLEVAKRAVEIAIEQNEEDAIDYINAHSGLMRENGSLHQAI